MKLKIKLYDSKSTLFEIDEDVVDNEIEIQDKLNVEFEKYADRDIEEYTLKFNDNIKFKTVNVSNLQGNEVKEVLVKFKDI
jgi:hypothetical protein